jgi:hypothetical protein
MQNSCTGYNSKLSVNESGRSSNFLRKVGTSTRPHDSHSRRANFKCYADYEILVRINTERRDCGIFLGIIP